MKDMLEREDVQTLDRVGLPVLTAGSSYPQPSFRAPIVYNFVAHKKSAE